ncbi:MAG TPA: ParB/RepB/Spo0J family partition protein [Firmicutes bacterium]|nr:ParB/RepB/Spo0J family partition protein [Bacillota bacterium]
MGLKRGKKAPEGTEVQNIPIELIDTNPFQPRERFDEESLRELSESIKQHGVIQAIVVRRAGQRYEVVVGERRLRASRMAGLSAVPAIVKDMDDREMAEVSLVENLQRKDLNVVEEAQGYQRLIQEFGLTQQDVAERVGKDQSTVANKLRLLKLSPVILENIAREIISERHARALLRLPNEEEQINMMKRICEGGWTVSQAEEAIEARIRQLAEGGAEATPERRKVVRALKDLRLFTNSIRQVVRELKRTGIRVRFEEREVGDWLELRIKINKASAAGSKRASKKSGNAESGTLGGAH